VTGAFMTGACVTGAAGARPGWRAAIAAGLLCLLPPTTAPAADVGVAPHRAFYDLSLARAAPGTGIESVSGVMSFELEESCESWVLTQRLLFVTRTDRGGGHASDIAYTAWEGKDGRDFAFHTRIRADDETVEEVKGGARFEAAGGAGVARFSRPAARRVPLPTGTLLPVAHMAELLARAAAGETLHSAPLFDGSSADGALLASVFVGRRLPAPEEGAAGPLREGASWRVSAALYPLSGAVELPVYRTAFRLWDTGVAQSLVIDYGDYALAGGLQRVVPLARPDCPSPTAPSGR